MTQPMENLYILSSQLEHIRKTFVYFIKKPREIG